MKPVGYNTGALVQRARSDQGMSKAMESSEPEARYIPVQDVEYELVPGCARTFRKHLLTTDRLEVRQTLIRGPGNTESYGASAHDRVAYVLAGTAVLENQDCTQVGRGQLIVIPAGARWGEQLSLLSDELVLLEVARAEAHGASDSGASARIRAVNPADVERYEPAGHAKTQNRCLFVDEHMEIIEGMIERGGGAERHFHRDNEQLLYVLGGLGVPLLIHYPKGAPHGTGGGISEPLELLVIYSPPLGESQNALA
jgi:quercetin dioxygenase-like cupin family protein